MDFVYRKLPVVRKEAAAGQTQARHNGTGNTVIRTCHRHQKNAVFFKFITRSGPDYYALP